jgi:cytochrome c-type biogenesis protein CcmE
VASTPRRRCRAGAAGSGAEEGWIVNRKKLAYALSGVAVLALAGTMIFQALSTSLVYFILPNEHAADPAQFANRRIRLGGIVAPGTMAFDDRDLRLTFLVTDGLVAYPVAHTGAPPELFKENTGVVIEGRFHDGTFVSDNLLVKHTEVYVAEDDHIDVVALRESLK